MGFFFSSIFIDMDANEMRKFCPKCKIEKDGLNFSKNKNKKDGLNNICKVCKKEQDKKSYIKNKESINLKSQKWYNENREVQLIKQSKYNKLNPNISRRAVSKYESNNRELINFNRRERYHNDPKFRLRIILGNRLNELLKKNNIKKDSKIIDLLGCDLDTLKIFIEEKFSCDMYWGNHGTFWELDHIKPCDSFDLTKLEEQRRCFHFTNLQPLTKSDNRIKSNKI